MSPSKRRLKSVTNRRRRKPKRAKLRKMAKKKRMKRKNKGRRTVFQWWTAAFSYHCTHCSNSNCKNRFLKSDSSMMMWRRRKRVGGRKRKSSLMIRMMASRVRRTVSSTAATTRTVCWRRWTWSRRWTACWSTFTSTSGLCCRRRRPPRPPATSSTSSTLRWLTWTTSRRPSRPSTVCGWRGSTPPPDCFSSTRCSATSLTSTSMWSTATATTRPVRPASRRRSSGSWACRLSAVCWSASTAVVILWFRLSCSPPSSRWCTIERTTDRPSLRSSTTSSPPASLRPPLLWSGQS